jgi:hypothetical protein
MLLEVALKKKKIFMINFYLLNKFKFIRKKNMNYTKKMYLMHLIILPQYFKSKFSFSFTFD